MQPAWLARARQAGRSLAHGLGQLALPACCFHCERPLGADEQHFCAACRSALGESAPGVCATCAATIGPHSNADGRCRFCRDERFAFDRVLRLGEYDGALREAVLRIKHREGEVLGELLGEMWAAQVQAQGAAEVSDVIIPVPLYWWRRWARGYNQSVAVARGIGGRLGLPVRTRWLRRRRDTLPQHTQSASARRENMRGAFAVTSQQEVAGRSVLLVDDVMTTGATVHEAARALRQAGAARIVVAVLARASNATSR